MKCGGSMLLVSKSALCSKRRAQNIREKLGGSAASLTHSRAKPKGDALLLGYAELRRGPVCKPLDERLNLNISMRPKT
jgi:hypothetical protein